MTKTEWMIQELQTAVESFANVPHVAPKGKREEIVYQNGLRAMALFMLEKLEANESYEGARQLFGKLFNVDMPQFQSELKIIPKKKNRD